MTGRRERMDPSQARRGAALRPSDLRTDRASLSICASFLSAAERSRTMTVAISGCITPHSQRLYRWPDRQADAGWSARRPSRTCIASAFRCRRRC